MKHGLSAFCSIVFVTAVFSQGEDSAKDVKSMQGAWAAVIEEVGGKPASDDEKKVKIKVVITGEKYVTYFNDKVFTKGVLKIDAGKKPRTMDATPEDGPGKGMLQPGIYQLEGDAMKVLFAMPGGKRPTEFKTKDGSEEVLITYKRIAKK